MERKADSQQTEQDDACKRAKRIDWGWEGGYSERYRWKWEHINISGAVHLDNSSAKKEQSQDFFITVFNTVRELMETDVGGRGSGLRWTERHGHKTRTGIGMLLQHHLC